MARTKECPPVGRFGAPGLNLGKSGQRWSVVGITNDFGKGEGELAGGKPASDFLTVN